MLAVKIYRRKTMFRLLPDSGRENDIKLQKWGRQYVKNGTGFYQIDERAKKRAVCFACIEFC